MLTTQGNSSSVFVSKTTNFDAYLEHRSRVTTQQANEICTIPAPADLPAGMSRPILMVMQLGEVLAYASFKNGHYEFPIDPETRQAIASGHLDATFKYDGDVPVAIILRNSA